MDKGILGRKRKDGPISKNKEVLFCDGNHVTFESSGHVVYNTTSYADLHASCDAP